MKCLITHLHSLDHKLVVNIIYLSGQIKKFILMGIKPTYPSDNYGYILPVSQASLSTVKAFKEKPDAVTAEKYITQGALWNAGVFSFFARLFAPIV